MYLTGKKYRLPVLFLALVISLLLLNHGMISAGEIKEEYPEIEKAKSETGSLNIQGASEDRIIIKYREGSPALNDLKDNERLLTKKNRRLIKRKYLTVMIDKDRPLEQQLEFFNSRKDIEYAEIDSKIEALFLPNDTYYTQYQWNFDIINSRDAWDIAGGGDSSIVIAVLDTGVAYENYSPYIKASDLSSSSFIPGYDIVNGDTHPNDDNGHGTHICGTIAQTTNNSYGTAGLAFESSIMPIKMLDHAGNGYASDSLDGIYWAVDNGADIINISYGGTTYLNSEHEAVQYAVNNGLVVVAATGNDNGSIRYPAAYPESIAVGSVGQSKTRSSFSNFGSQIDVVAPGESILQEALVGDGDYNTAFYFYNGTSSSTPHVSALAALVLSVNPSLSPQEVESAIKQNCEDLGSTGFDNYYGMGLIDTYATIFSVMPEGDIAVSPGEDFFSDTGAGFSGTRQFVISNQGTGDLQVGQITITGDEGSEFAIISDGASNSMIASGDSAIVEVQFNPSTDDARDAYLLIPSDDSDENPLEVYITGGKNIQDFVTRFYELCLERTPDSSGLKYWANSLISGDKTGEDASYGFVFSDEFLNRNLEDRDFVETLYYVILGRVSAPSPDEMEGWLEKLANGATRSSVLSEFINAPSGEFDYLCQGFGIIPSGSGITGFVNRFYGLTLNRTPDIEGQAYWTGRLQDGLETGKSIGNNFIFSEEFTDTSPDDREFIATLYGALLGRSTPPDDMNYWINWLDSGNSRKDLFDEFTTGRSNAEFVNICNSYGIEPY
jgi:serine protease